MSLSYYYSMRDKYQGYVDYNTKLKNDYIDKQKKYIDLKSSLETAILSANALQSDTSAAINKIGTAIISGGKGFEEENLTTHAANMGSVASKLGNILVGCQSMIDNLQKWHIDVTQRYIDSNQKLVDEYQAKINAEEARLAQEAAAEEISSNKKTNLPPIKDDSFHAESYLD